jgi:hypothetical protein
MSMKRKGALSKSQPTCRIICGFACRYRSGIRLMPPVGTGTCLPSTKAALSISVGYGVSSRTCVPSLFCRIDVNAHPAVHRVTARCP